MLLVIFIYSGVPDVMWERSYGGSDLIEKGKDVKQTSDGGYIVVADRWSLPSRYDEWIYLLKIDDNGDTLWTKKYENKDWTGVSVCRVCELEDGGYIILGGYDYAYHRVWVMRTDRNGDSLWLRTYGVVFGSIYGNSIIEVEGGYVIGGYIVGAGGIDVYIFKVDGDGDRVWEREYGEKLDDESCLEMERRGDGGYMVVGDYKEYGEDEESMYLLRLDDNFDTLWSRVVSDENLGFLHSMDVTGDNGCIVGGTLYEGDTSYAFVIKVDKDGNKEWSRRYKGFQCNSIIETEDGGYVIGGPSSYRGSIVKLNKEGDVVWDKTLHGSLNSILQTKDRGYVGVGYSGAFQSENVYIVRLGPDYGIKEKSEDLISFFAIERRGDGYVIRYRGDLCRGVEIYDVMGRRVNYFRGGKKRVNEVYWDLRDSKGERVGGGVYFVKSGGEVKKVIVIDRGWR